MNREDASSRVAHNDELGNETLFEEAVRIAEKIAKDSCEHAFRMTGERPHYVRRGNEFFIVWPDGEETNSIDISWVQ